jgi:hypothetical protein
LQTAQPDGSSVYTGSIPASDFAEVTRTDDTATRLAARLQSVGESTQFKLVVGSEAGQTNERDRRRRHPSLSIQTRSSDLCS